jgi:hypothetical protein
MTDPRSFLRSLFAAKPGDAYVLIWTLDDKRSHWFREIDRAAEFVESARGRDIYVGVGLSPQDFGPSRRCPSDKVLGLAGFWADFDLKSEAHAKTKLPTSIEEALSVIPPAMSPTVVIATGNGAHAWWLFKEPLLFDTTDERQSAAALIARWQTLLRLNAAARGWAFDRLSDLARVLRIPGTLNNKDPRNPKPVSVHSNAGRMEDAPVVIDLNAAVPDDLLNRYMTADLRFKNTWLRQRHDLRDQSQSGYDLALADFGVDAGLADQQIVDLIIHHRRLHGERPRKNADYFERTLAPAAERKGGVDPFAAETAAADPTQQPQSDPPPKPQDPEPDPAAAKAILCERVSQALGVRVLRLHKVTGEEPTYVMELENATIKFSGVGKLIDQASVRVAVAAAVNRLIPRIKPKAWERLAQTMLDALTEQEGGDETDTVGVTKMYPTRYLTESAFIPSIETQPIQSIRKPTAIDGHVAVSASDLQMHVNKAFFLSLTVKAIAQMLTVLGAKSVRIRGARLRDQSRWLLPKDLFDPADFTAPPTTIRPSTPSPARRPRRCSTPTSRPTTRSSSSRATACQGPFIARPCGSSSR